jgi:hypothetical protein
MQKLNFVEKKAIEEIGDRYNKYDFQLSKIINFPNDNPISADGLSLLDDIEFFLSQPGFNQEVEAELFKLIQVFSLQYLRARRGSND